MSNALVDNSQIAQSLLNMKARAKVLFSNYISVIKITQKNPFEAVIAGELGGENAALLLGMSTDEVTARSGAMNTVLSNPLISAIIVIPLECEGDDCEEERTLELYALTEMIKNGFKTVDLSPDAETRFSVVSIGRSIYLYDEQGIWMASETTIQPYIVSQ